MFSLNTFTISLKEISEENQDYYNEETRKSFLELRKKIFLVMTERALDYRNNNTGLLFSEEKSRFEKRYLVINKDNVVLNYLEKYRLADEKLRNHAPQVFSEEIAVAELELEDIIINVQSTGPLETFKQNFYLKLTHDLENYLK
jgi:hypothetical protein